MKDKNLFLIGVFHRRLEYPALKRAVREQRRLFGATEVLIEDKASGTQLIQELITEGCYGVTRYQPTGDKTMRLHAQTALIENGFVRIPEAGPSLAEYLHEMTVLPRASTTTRLISTAQFLDWFKKPFPSQGIYEYYRQLAETAAQQSKPPPVKSNYAPGCMEWLAEDRRKRGQPRRPTPCLVPRRMSSDTACQPQLAIAGGATVRIRLSPG